MDKKKYPIGAEHYTLYEEVGQGVSASVHRALCIPFNEVVAVKILDFERDNSDLSNISREAQTMILVDHPNVLKSHCSFVSDHNLWVVMPFMSGGSCLHILKAAYPDGFEEVVIATILRESGNILIDVRGAIKLGDFGVSACLFDSGDRQRMRNTFVGTPCWMAPEVMEQLHGYDFKADIWSFGITALELAHGHAPFSKYPPMKVLLMTLQNAPPGLDYERDRKFSKMIASCLVKDPSKRPSAKKLLKHSFFKQARSNEYIARALLEGLPALGDRIKALKKKEEDMLAQKKMPDGQKEEISQIQDEDMISESNHGGSSSTLSSLEMQGKQSECQVAVLDDNDLMQNQLPPHILVESTMNITKLRCDKSDDDSSVASPCFEQYTQLSSPCHDDRNQNNPSEKPSLEGTASPSHQRAGSTALSESIIAPVNKESDKLQNQLQNNSCCDGATTASAGDDAASEIPSKEISAFLSNLSVTVAANSDELDEKAKPPVIQQKGRFKVTSENVVPPTLQKSHSMQVRSSEVRFLTKLSFHGKASNAPAGLSPVLSQSPAISSLVPSDTALSNLSGNSLFPMLCNVLQTNILQRESILNLMKQVSVGDCTAIRLVDGGGTPANTVNTEKSLLEAAHDREKDLLHEITDLQWRLICAQDELQKYKTENPQVTF
ncbi:protein kinase domain-containing protein [Citrus sinensis]|uniref:Protein kinase domain-containing protein n=2 Tax=Citrus sinensis TaxID=2711 RepID=A0ACB8JDJ2_CITSI|nr:protein kinase domain-containing protein [Citrus sinensis]